MAVNRVAVWGPMLLLCTTVAVCGCWNVGGQAGVPDGGDVDSDTDNDTDTDSDSDTDSDTDTDTDSDTDTDTDYCDVYDCWLTEPTNQALCYDDWEQMTCTSFPCNFDGSPDFCGQDAQYPDNTRTFTCYDAVGALQDPCDGTANQGETVVDSLTGLEWQRTWTTEKTWQEALDYCEGLDYGGHNDWRLPSCHELAGIVDYGKCNPAIDTVAFPGTPFLWPSSFWSSSPYGSTPDEHAWRVDFYSGQMLSYNKQQDLNVRCVRGGPYHGTSPVRFQVSGSAGQEVVLDRATGLEWQKEYGGGTWQEVLQYCEGLDYGGHDDWRLPNINELRGIVDIDFYNPASGFPDISTHVFCSSSSLVSNPDYTWNVSFYSGHVDFYGKAYGLGARCVRSGP